MKTPTTPRPDAADDRTASPSTMRAIVTHEYGPPADVLELGEIEKPTVGDDQVLVRVGAAGTHIGDWLVMNGLPYLVRLMGYGLRTPKNEVPGTEMAGVVEAVGRDVTRFQAGDEVFGGGRGTFAEYVAVSPDALAVKPANVTFEQAAAAPVSGLTALQALRDKGRVQSGQTVLVIGASGAVGTYAVQIAKALGAEVTGVCSTRNVDLVRSIGADHVIDYTHKEITDDARRYDVVIDTAGNRSLRTLRRALTPKGTLVIVGGTGGRWFMGVGRSIRARLVSPFVSQRLTMFLARITREDLEVLADLMESGKVIPVIDETHPLADTAQAMDHVGGRHTRGKTVITI